MNLNSEIVPFKLACVCIYGGGHFFLPLLSSSAFLYALIILWLHFFCGLNSFLGNKNTLWTLGVQEMELALLPQGKGALCCHKILAGLLSSTVFVSEEGSTEIRGYGV